LLEKARKFWWIFILVLVVFSGLGLRMLVKRIDYFNLRQIDIVIEGQNKLTQKKIAKWANVRYGQNIFSIDLKALQQRLQEHPWIKHAFISRKLPDELFIKVVEEKPIAMVSYKDQIYLVDQAGRIFAQINQEDPVDLAYLQEVPGLAGLSKEEFSQGHLAPYKKPILDLLVRLKKKEGMVPCYANISQINFLKDGFVLMTRDKIRIKLKGNNLSEILYAYRRLDKLINFLYQRKLYSRVKMIRLDYPKNENKQDQAAIVFRKDGHG